MKNKSLISLLTYTGLNKNQKENSKALAEEQTNAPAKVISMYPRPLPVSKQAKIISMFG